jgi:hypothetical protein
MGALLAIACAVALGAPIASGANIVLNPGFEEGNAATGVDFTNWKAVFLVRFSRPWYTVSTGTFNVSGASPNGGDFFAESYCPGPDCITIPLSAFYQDLPTITGQTYTLSFWYDLGSCKSNIGPNLPPPKSDGCGTEELNVLWGGNAAFDLAATPSGTTDPGWVLATVEGLQATADSTRLEFLGRQDPAGLAVDDISVSPVSPVSEPSSMVLLGGGLLAVGAIGYREIEGPFL